MNASDKIYVAGHRGMVGSAVCRALAKQGYTSVVTRTHKELDLLDPAAVRAFYEAEKPDLVNVGSGEDVSIRTLAEKVKAATGCTAEIVWDVAKLDDTPRKLCDTTLIRLLAGSQQSALTRGLCLRLHLTVSPWQTVLSASDGALRRCLFCSHGEEWIA